MSDSIVHQPGGRGKLSAAQIKTLLRLAAAPSPELPAPIESAAPDEVVGNALDLIDGPLVRSMDADQMIAFYLSQIHIFEPKPVKEIRRNGPIRSPRGWRAAADADRRSRRSDSGDRPSQPHDPR